MKTIIFSAILLFSTTLLAQHMETLDKISWYGQAAIKISHDGKNIYIDPFQMPDAGPANLVLITHSHGDHLSFPDIEKIATKNTTIVCPHECKDKLSDEGYKNIITVAPGEKITVEGFSIEAVPMYNIVKTNYHPKENNWTGFIIEIGDSKLYHAGDTEHIPEMANIDCDIVMLPLGQTYTMNSVEEAAEAALATGAKIAIPIHYGLYEGTEEDAIKFRQLLSEKLDVVILDRTK